MLLRKFRKDSSLWDIAIVAVLLNAFLQVGCFMGAASASEGFSSADPAIWCSIDKAGAAASAQTGDADGHASHCSDCRECTGQSVAIAPLPDPVALAPVPAPVFQPPRHLVAGLDLALAPYEGRAPPLTLQS